MKALNSWFGRAGAIAAATVAAVVVTAVPAQAAEYSLSTTGAAGIAVYIKNGDWRLDGKDTLSDGHCAQWQERWPGNAWAWKGSRACSGSWETAIGWSRSGYQVRICRTGVGNCSGAVTLP